MNKRHKKEINNKYENIICELKLSKKYCSKIIEYNKTGFSEYPVEYYLMHLKECLPLEKMDLKDQAILWDLYLLGKCANDVALDKGFERSSLYRHIKRAVSKVV